MKCLSCVHFEGVGWGEVLGISTKKNGRATYLAKEKSVHIVEMGWHQGKKKIVRCVESAKAGCYIGNMAKNLSMKASMLPSRAYHLVLVSSHLFAGLATSCLLSHM
ncbi:hypothetical protein U1Q18_003286 [Sarracenia purpurea var. burkii]